MKMSNAMKIRTKPIENVRIRLDRAEKLKEKAFEISMMTKEHVYEADLVNFLIDTFTTRISVRNGELYINEEKG